MNTEMKNEYESPCMDCIRVEAECDFMSGSVMKDDSKPSVESSGQEINQNTIDADGWTVGEATSWE